MNPASANASASGPSPPRLADPQPPPGTITTSGAVARPGGRQTSAASPGRYSSVAVRWSGKAVAGSVGRCGTGRGVGARSDDLCGEQDRGYREGHTSASSGAHGNSHARVRASGPGTQVPYGQGGWPLLDTMRATEVVSGAWEGFQARSWSAGRHSSVVPSMRSPEQVNLLLCWAYSRYDPALVKDADFGDDQPILLGAGQGAGEDLPGKGRFRDQAEHDIARLAHQIVLPGPDLPVLQPLNHGEGHEEDKQ
jgi:hypothetical protein